jgi:hypothetical protein
MNCIYCGQPANLQVEFKNISIAFQYGVCNEHFEQHCNENPLKPGDLIARQLPIVEEIEKSQRREQIHQEVEALCEARGWTNTDIPELHDEEPAENEEEYLTCDKCGNDERFINIHEAHGYHLCVECEDTLDTVIDEQVASWVNWRD